MGRNIALWQNLWVGVGRFERRSSSARASLALCSRFNQFRSPYSWITMRRALRKRRVFDFVPSYLKSNSASSCWEKWKHEEGQNFEFRWHLKGLKPSGFQNCSWKFDSGDENDTTNAVQAMREWAGTCPCTGPCARAIGMEQPGLSHTYTRAWCLSFDHRLS